AKKVERVGDDPRPDQPDHRKCQYQRRQHRERKSPERGGRRARSVAMDGDREQEDERAERRGHAEPAEDARGGGEGEADAGTSDAGAGRGYSSRLRTRPCSRIAIATANGPSLAFMNSWPT